MLADQLDSSAIDALAFAQQLQVLDRAQTSQYVEAFIAKIKAQLDDNQRELTYKQTKIDALALEVARLKRWRFGASSESVQSSQSQLFDAKTEQALITEHALEDRASDAQLAALASPQIKKRTAKRQALPAHLPRTEHHYEIEPALCSLGHPLTRMGEEIGEQLDCIPAQFLVLRHIRGKYRCACCQTILTAAMPAQVIDKGVPAPGLLAQVIIAKHDDHLPLYRQEEIYARSGAHIARSSMASWIGQSAVQLMPLVQVLREHLGRQTVLHADETPVSLLSPGKGQTHQAYVWAYRSSDLQTDQRAVVYDFANSRQGVHARAALKDFAGTLVADDYSGYKALFALGKVSEAGCWAHARRKFFEVHQLNQSLLAKEALDRIGQLYAAERHIEDLIDQQAQQEAAQGLSQEVRQQVRQKIRAAYRLEMTLPLLQSLKTWLMTHRPQLAKADATARAMDYVLGRWAALMRFAHDPCIAIDNNAVENAMRPIALGRKNWLFVGSEQAGHRAMALMSLIESAKLNGHDAWVYLKDVLTKLPTWPNSRIHELLPYHWQMPASCVSVTPR